MKQRKGSKAKLTRLLENVIEKTELVLNARSINGKLQDVAEDIAKIEANDLMPIMDAFRDAFGSDVTERFENIVSQQLRSVVDAIRTAKDAIGNQISVLEKAANGEDVSDMHLDMQDALPAPAEQPSEVESDLGAEEPEANDLPPAPEDDAALMGGNAAGRAKRESALPRGKKLAETMNVPAPPEKLGEHLRDLMMFDHKAGDLAHSIEQSIAHSSLPSDQISDLYNVLTHLTSMADKADHWSNADEAVEWALKSAHVYELKNPLIKPIVSNLKRLAHLLSFKHEDMMQTLPLDGMMESNISQLRESKNPDALVLESFRKSMKSGKSVKEAAITTAKSFAIDVSDILSIVKEAKENDAIKVQRHGKNSYRLMKGEKVVGMALKLANDRWGMYDTNDKRITKVYYNTPKDVAAAFGQRSLSEDGSLPPSSGFQAPPPVVAKKPEKPVMNTNKPVAAYGPKGQQPTAGQPNQNTSQAPKPGATQTQNGDHQEDPTNPENAIPGKPVQKTM